eukprot:4196529-Amphidinium_carterae.2
MQQQQIPALGVPRDSAAKALRTSTPLGKFLQCLTNLVSIHHHDLDVFFRPGSLKLCYHVRKRAPTPMHAMHADSTFT